MQDEVRVTVVATGLNRTAAARQPIGRGDGLREPMRAPIKLVRDGTTGLPIDDGFGGGDAIATAAVSYTHLDFEELCWRILEQTLPEVAG